MASASDFLKSQEKELIVSTIRKAEMESSGEIRVHIDTRCDHSPIDRAIELFQHLGMDQTSFRNAVLIYIAVQDKKFAVIGDEALHKKVDNSFWDKLVSGLQENFRNENYCNGIINCIEQVGAIQKKYFPDIHELANNELNDEISFE